MTKKLLLAFSNQDHLQDYIWKCCWLYLGWTWKQCAMTVFYVISPFVSSMALFPSRKKWLSYLSHSISPYLHGKVINWTNAFYLSFCCTVLPRILNILIFMNRVISIICTCKLYFHMWFYIKGICINFDNQQIYHLINLYFFCCLCGTGKFCFDKISRDFVRLSKLWVIRLYIVVWLI